MKNPKEPVSVGWLKYISISLLGLLFLLFCTLNQSALASPVFISSFNTQSVPPIGIDFNTSNSQTIVSSASGNILQLYNNVGTFSSQFGSGTVSSPHGVFFSTAYSNEYFVADTANNQVDVFNSAGVLQSTFGTGGSGPGQFNTPTDVTISAANQIFVSDSGNSRIQIWTNPTTFSTSFGTAGSGNGQFNNAYGVAYNAASNQIIVSDTGNNRIQIFSTAGTFQTSFGSLGSGNNNFNTPMGVRAHPGNGEIFVVDQGNNRIQVLTNGVPPTFSSSFGSNLNSPIGIALSSTTGQLWITDTNNTQVQIYFDPTLWTSAGTSTLSVLPSTGQFLSLAAGFNLNVLGQTSFNSSTTLSLNGGSFTSGSVFMDGGTLTAAANATVSAPMTLSPNGGILIANGGVTFNYTGAISSQSSASGQSALLKQGTGILIFSGVNTFVNGIAIQQGTLQMGATNTMPSTGSVTVSGTFNLNGFNQTIGDLSGGGPTTLGSGFLTFGTATSSVNYSGNISGTGGLIKQGSGMAILGGTNNYSGGTTVVSGILQGNTASLPGNFSLQDSSTLQFAQTTTGTYSGVISGSGSVSKINPGILIFSGNNTYRGGTTVSAGSLQAGRVNAFPLGGAMTIADSAILNLNNFSQTLGDLSGIGFITLGSSPGTVLVVGTATPSTTYSGQISGAGRFVKQGSGTLILLGANSYIGGTTLSAGTLQGNTISLQGNISSSDTTTLIFDQSFTGTYPGNISGTCSMIKQNVGNLILTGTNTFTGGTTINAGTLTVNGSLGSGVLVNAGGTLKGTGTINGTVTNNGTVSPGNSIGTLTMTGNYNPSASGVTSVEINSLGQNSALIVNGTTNLNGTLSVTADPGQYTSGMQFGIIHTPAVTGAFSSIPATIGPFKPSVVYNAGLQTLFLILTRGSVTGNLSGNFNSNEQAIANYFDSLPLPAVGSALGDLIGTLANVLTPAQLIQALDSINPGKLSAVTFLAEEQLYLLNYMNSSRMASMRRLAHEYECEGRSSFAGSALAGYSFAGRSFSRNPLFSSKSSPSLPFEAKRLSTTKLGLEASQNRSYLLHSVSGETTMWAQGFGYFVDQHPRKIDPGFDATTGGVVLGMDQFITKNAIAGIGVGRYRSRVNLDQDFGNIRANTNFLTLYGSWFRKRFYIEGSVIGAYAKQTANQHISFPTFDNVLQGGYHAIQLAPHLGAGYDFWICGDAMLTPFVGADYIYIREQAHTLANNTVLDMQINRKTALALYAEAGIRLSKTFEHANARFTPEASITYTNKAFRKGKVMAGLIGQTVPFFTVQNFSNIPYQITPGMAITVDLPNGGFVLADVTSHLGPGYRGFEVGLKLGFPF